MRGRCAWKRDETATTTTPTTHTHTRVLTPDKPKMRTTTNLSQRQTATLPKPPTLGIAVTDLQVDAVVRTGRQPHCPAPSLGGHQGHRVDVDNAEPPDGSGDQHRQVDHKAASCKQDS